MNLKEAYSILEIPESSTPEESKKRYRELTKKLHPDVNKEPGAEDKFKKINEAYQVVSTGKSTDKEEFVRSHNPFSGFGGPHNPFAGFNHGSVHQIENIILHTKISFKDSVLGCKQEIKFNRKIKCNSCNGEGAIPLNNGCDKCNGRGQTVVREGHMIFMQTCDKCHGKIKSESCKNCSGKRSTESETSINVTIPGGIRDGNVLRLAGMGHYINLGIMEQNTDAHLRVSVSAEPNLSLDGNDVVSVLQITLLEALQGCSKKVTTIVGEKEININSGARNKDEVLIPHLGVNKIGGHKVILDVKYPDNFKLLIDSLSSHKEN